MHTFSKYCERLCLIEEEDFGLAEIHSIITYSNRDMNSMIIIIIIICGSLRRVMDIRHIANESSLFMESRCNVLVSKPYSKLRAIHKSISQNYYTTSSNTVARQHFLNNGGRGSSSCRKEAEQR
jgi:hypothetical protein